MSILDRFRKKKKESSFAKASADKENVLPARHASQLAGVAGGDMVQEPIAEAKIDVAPKENTGLAHRILKNHHLSEKTNMFSTTGRYVFKVASDANKIEVKKAVETVYDVHVVKVNIVNVLGKQRRQGRVTGRTSDWKKAIVTLKTGEKISGLAQGV